MFTSGSLGEQEMLWEQKLLGECFHSFEFFQTFTRLDRNTGNMFSISFRKFPNKKKKQFVYFDGQNVDSLKFTRIIIMSAPCASSVLLHEYQVFKTQS